jgi:hypothetical protein
MDQDKSLRRNLIALLKGGLAFDTPEEVIKEFKPSERGVIPPGAEHSAWQILDHMVQSLVDIVEFSDNAEGKYREKEWPAGYWSKKALGDWAKSVKDLKAARKRMGALIKDPKRNLHEEFPWGDGQTLLRETLVAAEHLAYHIGELVELKRWIAAAPKKG